MDGPVRLTTAEVAKRLRLSEPTLRDWRRRGIGPVWFRLGPLKVFYWLRDVEAFEKEQQK
jgi:Helix-turn-helix domain